MNEKFASDYSRDFAQKHPEVGEIHQGAKLSAEAIRQLGDLVADKNQDVLNKSLMDQSATPQERNFLRSSADMMARTLLVAIEDNPTLMQQNESVMNAVYRIGNAAYMSDQVIKSGLSDRVLSREELIGANPADVHSSVDAAIGIIHQISSAYTTEFNIHSSNMMEITNAAFAGLEAVAETGQGLPVTSYTEGNLQNVLAQYELVAE